jgi:hypothetical protein
LQKKEFDQYYRSAFVDKKNGSENFSIGSKRRLDKVMRKVDKKINNINKDSDSSSENSIEEKSSDE